jgi:hypothetical protein
MPADHGSGLAAQEHGMDCFAQCKANVVIGFAGARLPRTGP